MTKLRNRCVRKKRAGRSALGIGLLLATAPVFTAMHAHGQVGSEAEQRRFDISAQPLAQAVVEFGRQSGMQVSVDTDLLTGLRSAPVSGSLPSDEALRRMLMGTGLVPRYVDGGTVVLEAPSPATKTLGNAVAGDGALLLDAVTVTGEKVSRSLRETASSVAVFDSETIEDRPRLNSAKDILDRVVNVTTSGTGNHAPVIRGVDGTGPAEGVDAFFAGTRPRLNVQIDGRPASYNEVIFGDFSLWDVEQVEVFRGPQSTQQGRNAIAGAVVVKTKDPTFEPEFAARLLAGNYSTRQVSGMASGPLIKDQLAARIAFDQATAKSFVDMPDYPGVSDPEKLESTSIRGKLLFQPLAIDGFSTKLTISHTEQEAPQSEDVGRPFGDHDVSYPQMPKFVPRATTGILDTTWMFADGLTFENKLALTDTKVERVAATGDGNVEIDGKEYVVEPRLRFEAFDGRLSGFGSLYYFHADQDEWIDVFGGGSFDDRTTTKAIFGELTLAVTETVDVTVGGRYEHEKRRRTGSTGPFAIDFDETYEVFLPKVGISWEATDALTVGATVTRGYNGGGAGFTYDFPFVSYTFDPEYVWNYEAFARADLLGGRLSLTANVFYSDYRDMQLPFDLNPDPDLWAYVVRNADKAETYGAEVSATWRAMPGLDLFGSFGLLQTEVTSYPGSDVEGNDLARAPAFTADMGVAYRHESGFDASVDARFSDAYYSDTVNAPRGKTDPYWVANAQVGYTIGNLRAFAFVRNLFDNDEPIELYPGATSDDDTARLLRPRTFGVGLHASF